MSERPKSDLRLAFTFDRHTDPFAWLMLGFAAVLLLIAVTAMVGGLVTGNLHEASAAALGPFIGSLMAAPVGLVMNMIDHIGVDR